MTYTSVFLLTVILTLILITIESNAMDPEIQLCKDMYIDAAVTADNNISYAFKGDFYWKIDPIKGIASRTIAKYTFKRWPGLTGPIDGAFTIDEQNYRLITVFLKGNQWFAYKDFKLKVNGTTDQWSASNESVLSAFEFYNKSNTDPKDNPVYLIYNNDKFVKYLIRDLKNPLKLYSGKTLIKGKYLWFLVDPTDKDPGSLPLSSLINATAIVTNKKFLTIFGKSMICSTKITRDYPNCDVEADVQTIRKFYGCPRNAFPTTTTIEITISMTTNQTTEQIFNQSSDDSTETNIGTTGVTINSDPIITFNAERTDPNSVTDSSFNTIVSLSTSKSNSEPNDKKSNIWLIIVIVVIVAICLIIFVCILIYVLKNKKQKTKKRVEAMNAKEKLDKHKGPQEYSLTTDTKPVDGKQLKLYSEDSETDLAMASVRSSLESADSNESLGTAMRRLKSRLKEDSDEIISLVKIESDIEADQLLQSIKSNDDLN